MSDVLRVCIVGAESSGTTTLARNLAEYYETLWVPEYGRDYTEARKVAGAKYEWKSEEFIHIALKQQEHEDRMAEQASRILFCDTDALATSIWHERYMGFWSPTVESVASRKRYTLYILTQPDIPFVQDRIRDSELLRDWMTDRFRVELTRRGYPWILVKGTYEARWELATAAVDRLLAGESLDHARGSLEREPDRSMR
jgi:HTH-type transcriptional repressor of NAD biosynthesis genes